MSGQREPAGFDVRIFIELALQAAEADALQNGCIPGWDMMADYVVNALRERRVAVIPLPEPRTDLHWDDGNEEPEWKVWVRPGKQLVVTRVEYILHTHEARALAGALLAAADAANAHSSPLPASVEPVDTVPDPLWHAGVRGGLESQEKP